MATMALHCGLWLTSTAVNAGNVKSGLMRNISNLATLAVNHMVSPFLYSPELGALTQLYANTAPEIEDLGTFFFVPWARPGIPAEAALRTEAQDASACILTVATWFDAQIERLKQ